MLDWAKLTKLDENLKGYLAKSGTEENPTETQSIYEHTTKLFNSLRVLVDLGYIQDEEVTSLVAKACKYHDIGKVNEEFSERIRSPKRKYFDITNEVPHNALSLFGIPRKELSDKEYYVTAYAVLHHHKISFAEYLDTYKEFLDKQAALYPNYLDPKNGKHRFLKAIDADAPYLMNSDEEKKAFQNLRTKVSGLLMKCDYAASGDYQIEYAPNYLEHTLERQLEKWSNKGESSGWNELQVFCANHKDDNLLVVGETGLGKTEGALLWIGDAKGFFFLPIRTAINAIYSRVAKEFLEGNEIDKKVALLHSSTLSYYLNMIDTDKDSLDAFLYSKRGKQLSLPLTISTVDQLFDFVFKNHGYELKLATLSYSKLVIDEIQMYDARLLAFLVYGMKLVSELGGKIAVLTATLPPFVADLLNDNLDFKEASFTKKAKPRHNVKVHRERLNIEHVMDCYNANTLAGRSNKILVICNTVSEAQRVYLDLKEMVHDQNHINLFHARFIKMDREKKEEEILAFGKTKNDDGSLHTATGIWITTSICEASLDIDFDYLFTELQYVTSLLQRFGRCNRKGIKDTSDYNCHVYTEIDEGLLQNQNGKGFIDKTLYELSVEALQGVDGLVSEEEKLSWIQEAFTKEKVKKSDYYTMYHKYFKMIRDRKVGEESPELDRHNFRDIDSVLVIPAAVFFKDKNLTEEMGGESTEPFQTYVRLRNVLNSRNSTAKEKAIARDELEKFTVSISEDLFNKNRFKSTRYEPLQVTSSWSIHIVDYYYDNEVGMRFESDTRLS